ncbi:MAG TPA: helix-turn-helix domain-containing protein [Clostridiaceae bacterium]|nr:helix-turn-helix domain-containing protein [Clostridiaceae bacterium]
MKKIFNNKNLSDEEILYIIKRFQPLIIKASFINGKFNEDLNQEIKLRIYTALTKGRKRIKNKISKKFQKKFKKYRH